MGNRMSRKSNHLGVETNDLESRLMMATTLTEDDSVDRIASVLSSGGDVVFEEGVYNFGKTVDVRLGTKTLNVTATGAEFVSKAIDGDLIRINGGGSSGAPKPDVTWTGGEFNIVNQRLGKVRPDRGTGDAAFLRREAAAKLTRESGAKVSKVATQDTADAIHIRGSERIGTLTIDRINVIGSNGTWRSAGGDSGVFVTDVENAVVKNSRFKGLRDAGVYISDSATRDKPRTKSVIVENNLVEDSYDGVTAKRGVDNVTFRNNTLIGNDVAASLRINDAGSKINETFRNIRFVGNFISNSFDDAFLLQDFKEVDLSNANDSSFVSNDIFLSKARSSVIPRKVTRNMNLRDADEISIVRSNQSGGAGFNVSGLTGDSGNSIKDGFASNTKLTAERTAFRQRGGFTSPT